MIKKLIANWKEKHQKAAWLEGYEFAAGCLLSRHYPSAVLLSRSEEMYAVSGHHDPFDKGVRQACFDYDVLVQTSA